VSAAGTLARRERDRRPRRGLRRARRGGATRGLRGPLGPRLGPRRQRHELPLRVVLLPDLPRLV